jgi:hypothetical protein
MVTKKQTRANLQNAIKSTGPKTKKGKAVASRNSLKHGLLAKEVVITEGEGIEDLKAFEVLKADLVEQFKPVGVLEEMLIEKIAVSYWRLRRAYSYEIGNIRKVVDTTESDFYGEYSQFSYTRVNFTNAEIDKKIQKNFVSIKNLKHELKSLKKWYANGYDLKILYPIKEIWNSLIIKMREEKCFFKLEYKSSEPGEIRNYLNGVMISDEQIWQGHIELCQEIIDECQQEIESLKSAKFGNRLELQITKKCATLLEENKMNKLLRYETAIENQLYRAINKLEHLQRLRFGDKVLAPMQLDLNISA